MHAYGQCGVNALHRFNVAHVDDGAARDLPEPPAIESELPRAIRQLRREDLVVRIEDALVVCAGTSNTSVFARAIRDLRGSVLAPVPRR